MLQYKCVNCGAPSGALYKTYGPSVLKLTKCERCKGIVDKYIEYDPVIIMIDLVLVSKEAQRHVLYNIEFKSFWKLFVILIMLETYGLWKNESLFNMYINTLCGVQGNGTNVTYLSLPIEVQVPESWTSNCWAWVPRERESDNDLFLWEKDFYIQFISIFIGIIVFLLTMHSSMLLLNPFIYQNRVGFGLTARAFTLAYGGAALALSPLVWAADAPPPTRALHHALLAAYVFVIFLSVYTVVYGAGTLATLVALAGGHAAKYYAAYHVAAAMRAALP